ncbi:uncharacterized protein TNCV_3745641 [Trichonephila clavipes]|nr:uncharacterized protein TNCV_3745641 [Trichonephila clavipes]
MVLQDEWTAMPQQLIHTLILGIGRRCETCLAVREIISPTKDQMFPAGHPSQGYEEYCEMVLLYGQCNRNKREATRLYANKFPPVVDIHLNVQLPVLFNACIKLEVVIVIFPYLVPHLQLIPAEDVLGYALAHPESIVRDISKACSYSKSLSLEVHILIVQS